MGLNDKRHTSLLLNVPNEVDLLKTEKTDRYGFVHKFGSNMVIGTTIEDIQSNGGVYTWPQSTFKAEVVSTDADDTFGGDGAWSVFIEGLEKTSDNLLFNVSEEINLDGLTPSVGLVDFFRINRTWVEKSGVYAGTAAMSQQGTIVIQTEGAGEIHAQLELDTLGFGQSLIARFSVPSDARAYLQNTFVCVDANKPVRYFIFQREDSNITSAPFTAKRIVFNAPLIRGAATLPFENPFKFEPNTDIWFAGVGAAGSTNEITVDFELTLKYFDLP